MTRNLLRFCALSLLFVALPAKAVYVYETVFGGGGVTIVGDIWLFNCPAGNNFTLSVDTAGREMGSLSADKSGLDPSFQVFDGTGHSLAVQHDDFTCTRLPYNGGSCPRVTNMNCGVGAQHLIAVWNAGTIPGGAYIMRLTVTNPFTGADLSEKQINLGGGDKPKLPTWRDPAKKAVSPLVDDGQLEY